MQDFETPDITGMLWDWETTAAAEQALLAGVWHPLNSVDDDDQF